MQAIRHQILECLSSYSSDDEMLISKIDQIISGFGPKAYPVLFHVLAHLNISQEEAEICWGEICRQRRLMSHQLGHSVNLRTAICDYFCSIHQSLKNPKVVEIHIFEETINTAKYDKLTGLYNRTYFDESIIRELGRAKRYDTELSILFLDIDNFKEVNDTHGHLAGDTILREVAQTIINGIRSEDVACRYGGDEMVIILPETRKTTGLILSERLREQLEKLSPRVEGKPIPITISGGLANFPIDASGAAELISYADTALYKAKALGKNCIQTYSSNNRRYARVAFSPQILVKKISLDEPTETILAQASDLSLTGILFRSSNPCFAIGDKIQLQIPFDDFNATALLLGTVVRVELLESCRYGVGVSFLEMEPPDRDEISRYLLKRLGQELAPP